MEDLLKRQIHVNTKLALPNGLKELMADVSREVIRAQPRDIYKFIKDYLAALLVTRANLQIASRVCTDICDRICQPGLDEELKDLDFDDAERVIALELIEKFLDGGGVHESQLLLQLSQKVDLDQKKLPGIQKTIRDAVMRHYVAMNKVQLDNFHVSPEFSNSADPVDDAVLHTLNIYHKTKPTSIQYCQAADRVQTSYHGYGVKREDATALTTQSSDGGSSEQKRIEDSFSSLKRENHLLSESSMSLAGSHILLPAIKPYNVADEIEETIDPQDIPESEYNTTDYDTHSFKNDGTLDEFKRSSNDVDAEDEARKTKIVFDLLDHEIKDEASSADDESNQSVEEENGIDNNYQDNINDDACVTNFDDNKIENDQSEASFFTKVTESTDINIVTPKESLTSLTEENFDSHHTFIGRSEDY